MTKRKIDELIEDYIARGGKVTVIPAAPKEEPKQTLSVKTPLNYDTLSLGDGEFFFGETRKSKTKKPRKKMSADQSSALVNSFSLPASILASLKRKLGLTK